MMTPDTMMLTTTRDRPCPLHFVTAGEAGACEQGDCTRRRSPGTVPPLATRSRGQSLGEDAQVQSPLLNRHECEAG